MPTGSGFLRGISALRRDAEEQDQIEDEIRRLGDLSDEVGPEDMEDVEDSEEDDLSERDRRPVRTLTDAELQRVRDALGGHVTPWQERKQCHAAAIAIVRAEVFPSARVARGTCKGVGGQHSWVVVGDDCFDEDALVVDPTLCGYDPNAPGIRGIYVGRAGDRHTPHHGYGSIWAWGKPVHQGGATIVLTPKVALSSKAENFLEILGPLDLAGWCKLLQAPINGWPAEEIIGAMLDTEELAPRVPIDTAGMVTRRNPQGLYLPRLTPT